MRVKLGRTERASGMSHQEYLAALQDAVAHSGLPVAQRGGRSAARAYRITAGPPLNPGYTSRCEFVDFEMSQPLSGTEFGRRLSASLPDGIDVLWQRRLPPGAPHLMASVESFGYEILGDFDSRQIEAFNASAHWPAVRKRAKKEQSFDLRQSVTLRVQPGRLIMRIAALSTGTPKPEDVLASVFGFSPDTVQRMPVTRTDITLSPPAMTHQPNREQP